MRPCATRARSVPLVVFAGKEYGTGSSRDWAAKGTILLGVRAVVAQSFERIHRSNLVGMGVVPLVFEEGTSWQTLGLKGDEQVTIRGLHGDLKPHQRLIAEIVAADGGFKRVPLICRIDTRRRARLLQERRHPAVCSAPAGGVTTALSKLNKAESHCEVMRSEWRVTGSLDINVQVTGVQLWGRGGWRSGCCVAVSRRLPLVAGLLIASSALARAGEPRALLELFTSQGCSSCPAADKLLGELAARSFAGRAQRADRLLGLSRLEGHARQPRAFGRGSVPMRTVRGDREVYTPQIVVNGATHVLGSDPRRRRARHYGDRPQHGGHVAAGLLSLSGDELNVTSAAPKDHRR